VRGQAAQRLLLHGAVRGAALVLRLRLGADLLELLVHGAQQEDERDRERGHDQEAEQPGLHVVDRGRAVGAGAG